MHDLFEQAPGVMIVFRGPEHVVEMANPAYFALSGLTPEIVGKPAREGLKRGYTRGMGVLLDAVYSSGEPKLVRSAKLLVNRTPGGPDEEAFADFVLQPMRDARGRVFGIFCQGHEVTNETRAREALEASREALRCALDEIRAILDSSHDAICVADADGRFAAVNRQAAALWGYRPEELVGRPCADVVHPDDADRTREEANRVRAGAPTNSFMNRILHKDGRAVPMMWSGAPAPERGAIIAIGRDMREHLAAEEKLRQAQKMEVIGRLTGGIAHDFNNLLAVVIGSAEALSEALVLQPELRELSELALDAAERGAELVSRLLACARSQPLAPQAIDCDAFLRGLKPMLQRTLGCGVRIDLDVEAPGLACAADRTQLTSAVLNLCINARDAMPGGGHIQLRLAQEPPVEGRPALVELSVEDDGEGMAPDVCARALEPFFTTKPEGRGSGLGLSMVHGFVAQSGGRLEIRSTPGAGTAVRMYLPRAHVCPAMSDPIVR